MKKFGMAVAGLCLMSAGALADEAVKPAQTMRITTGKIVATLEIPKSLSIADNKFTVDAQAVRWDANKNLYTATGHATVQVIGTDRQVLKIAADQINIGIGADHAKTLAATGKIVIQIQQNGKLMQIMGDSVVMEPQQAK